MSFQPALVCHSRSFDVTVYAIEVSHLVDEEVYVGWYQCEFQST